ncbi:MAG: hypothetical protein ABIR03_00245 [Ginsengibacter sp.]
MIYEQKIKDEIDKLWKKDLKEYVMARRSLVGSGGVNGKFTR